MSDDPDVEILLEMHRIGGAMEVRAVSTSDGLEVVFSAPASALQREIEQIARAKLAYVRSRMRAGQDPPGHDDGKGGIIV